MRGPDAFSASCADGRVVTVSRGGQRGRAQVRVLVRAPDGLLLALAGGMNKNNQKKLTLRTTFIRPLNPLALGRVAGGMSGNVRCTESACHSGTCSGDVMGCGGDATMACTGASVMWCVTQMAACGG
jgi:hypothetical protein